MFLIAMVGLSVYAFVKVGVATEPMNFDVNTLKNTFSVVVEDVKTLSSNVVEEVKVNLMK